MKIAPRDRSRRHAWRCSPLTLLFLCSAVKHLRNQNLVQATNLFVCFFHLCVCLSVVFFSSVDLIFSSNMSLSVVCLFVYKCVFVIYYCFFLFICICSIVKRIGITFSGLFVCLRHSLLVCFHSPVSEFLSCK